MNIDDLHLFTRLSETGSLSAVARQLDVTPATVSAALKRMERQLGVRLLERTTRSARLTAEGERFLQTCQAMLLTWARGKATLNQGLRSVEGRIRMAAPADTSLQFLSVWLGEYKLLYPKTDITVMVGDHMHGMTREAVDIAIRYGELTDSSMVCRRLHSSERVLVAAPDYVKRFGLPNTPSDLQAHRCLAWLTREQPKSQWSFQAADGTTETVSVRPSLCGDSALVRSWALQGEGIAYKALIDVRADIREGRLVRLLTQYVGEPVPINAIMQSARYLPARVRTMLMFLAERFSRA